jgi:hypothetical protein
MLTLEGNEMRYGDLVRAGDNELMVETESKIPHIPADLDPELRGGGAMGSGQL